VVDAALGTDLLSEGLGPCLDLRFAMKRPLGVREARRRRDMGRTKPTHHRRSRNHWSRKRLEGSIPPPPL